MKNMAFNPAEHFISLRGRDYLPVAWRLVWFREEHPAWTVRTELVDLDRERRTAIFRAFIEDGNGRVLSTGCGSGNISDFRDYLEKAETKSIGRALAVLGYGTQFAPELDEGEKPVDSPVPAKKSAAGETAEKAPGNTKEEPAEESGEERRGGYYCEKCGARIYSYIGRGGKPVSIAGHCEASRKSFGRLLCPGCIKEVRNA